VQPDQCLHSPCIRFLIQQNTFPLEVCGGLQRVARASVPTSNAIAQVEEIKQVCARLVMYAVAV
jgi:hypothetical protein